MQPQVPRIHRLENLSTFSYDSYPPTASLVLLPTTVWQRLGLVLSTFVLLALTLVLVVQRASHQFITANEEYLTSQSLVSDLRRLLSLAQDVETGQGGYIITRDTNYLRPYQKAVPSMGLAIATIRSEATALPEIFPQIDSISSLIQRQQLVVDSSIDAANEGDFARAIAMVRTGRGKAMMDDIRRHLGVAESTAIRSQSRARGTAQKQWRETLIAIILAACAAVLLALVAGAIVQSELSRARSEKEELDGRMRATTSELARQGEHFRVTMSAIPVAVVATDLEGRVTFWSPGAERLFGLEAGAVAGNAPRIVPEDLAGEDERFRRSTLGGAPIAGADTTRLHSSGAIRNVTVSTDVIRDGEGRITGMVSAYLDSTSHHKLAEQFRQSQKLEAIGRLAGGIAHDFNNLLTAILGFADRALDRLPPSERRREDLREITLAAERAAGLTRQLLSFSRPRPINPQVLEVSQVVRQMETMLRRVMEERIDLNFITATDSGRIRADAHHLEQILLNLCINARDAMPHGGRLTVEVARAELDQAYTGEHPGLQPGHYTMLSVSDTGIGMDEATRRHIFEPFFSTKGEGRGTGLGLATVYGIVAAASGGIMVYSEPGRGSSFKVFLPTVDAPPESLRPPAAAAGALTTGTVLLVEDNPQLRSLARTMLEEAGFAVTACSSAEQALDRTTRCSASPDVMVTDLVLGGISGLELSRLLRTRLPHLGIVFVSGYTEETAQISEALADPNIRFLEKPFRRVALIDLVSGIMAKTRSTAAHGNGSDSRPSRPAASRDRGWSEPRASTNWS